MKKNHKDGRRDGGFSRIALTLTLFFVIFIIAYAVYKLFFMPDPMVNGTGAFKFLPSEKTVNLQAKHLSTIEVTLYQDGREIELLKDSAEVAEKVYHVRVNPGELGLKDGRALVTVKAQAGFFKDIQYDVEAMVDTKPPVLNVVTAPSLIDRGGSGFAVLRAEDAETVSILLGERTFPAFEAVRENNAQTGQADGGVDQYMMASLERSSGTSTYYALFPAPFDVTGEPVYYAVAVDTAGNRSVRALPTKLKQKQYRKSTITIDDSFIQMVISPLLNVTGIPDPEEAFRTVNEEWRAQSQEKLRSISGNSRPEMLWKGRFLQLKNSKVMATYGDQRSYIYDGGKISNSVHLGYDLASYANAPIEAANSGVVIFAGDLGIYGNTVIIDHGLGLMSLYGHMSSITVSQGTEIEKGGIIGNTGATGLAGGDHLHFGILIHGYEVSPLHWWDPRWIQVHITDHLDGK